MRIQLPRQTSSPTRYRGSVSIEEVPLGVLIIYKQGERYGCGHVFSAGDADVQIKDIYYGTVKKIAKPDIEVLHVYAFNTYCTWSRAIQDSPETLLMDNNRNMVPFKSLDYKGDPKQLDLGGSMQRHLKRFISDPDYIPEKTDDITEFKRIKDGRNLNLILTGGSKKDRINTLQTFANKFPDNQFYMISPEDEGRLTLESCIGRFVAIYSGYNKVFMFARGSTDLHMACYVPDANKPQGGETTKSDTVVYGDQGTKYASDFVDDAGTLTDQRIAVIFAGRSRHEDFYDQDKPGDGFGKNTVPKGDFMKCVPGTHFPISGEGFVIPKGATYKKTQFAQHVFEHIKSKASDVHVFVGSGS